MRVRIKRPSCRGPEITAEVFRDLANGAQARVATSEKKSKPYSARARNINGREPRLDNDASQYAPGSGRYRPRHLERRSSTRCLPTPDGRTGTEPSLEPARKGAEDRETKQVGKPAELPAAVGQRACHDLGANRIHQAREGDALLGELAMKRAAVEAKLACHQVGPAAACREL